MKKISTLFIPIILVASIGVLSGCATIIHGSDQEISVTSTPQGADVEIQRFGGVSLFRGNTPLMVNLDRDKEYNVVIRMEGYKETTVFINNTFDVLFLGNIICGGIIGMAVDAITGAMWELEPDMIHISLATASLMDGTTQTYAVFRALDEDGNLREMSVPLVREN